MRNQKSTKIIFRLGMVAFLLIGSLTFVGCENGSGPSPAGSATGQNGSVILNGAGATFPSPVYANWSYNYTESTQKQVQVNYQGTGSGAGINQLKEGTIDFAGTDAPLTSEELKESDLVQFPMLAGGVVVIVNVPGVKNGELKLSQKTLAEIYLGKIKKWNDPALTAENPELKLPALDITVVHRSDSSGTTFLFTKYLEVISSEWKEKVGSGKSVNWPVGIGGQKNPGVCNNVTRIMGSIGYTEYTYAIETKLTVAKLQNKDGKYVMPEENSFKVALKKAQWKPETDFYTILVNAEGEESWPILGVTYILYSKKMEQTTKSQLHKYISWCYESGKSSAKKMHYMVIPENVVGQIRDKIGMTHMENENM